MKHQTRKNIGGIIIVANIAIIGIMADFSLLRMEFPVDGQNIVKQHKTPTGWQNEPNLTLVETGNIITAEITAYSAIDSCHTGESCLMASGKRAYIGAIACPRYISFGTRVIIDNITYTCEDRVSVKYPERFDIFMGYGEDAHNKAILYGKKIKEITVEQMQDI